jgi:hypothetical protein
MRGQNFILSWKPVPQKNIHMSGSTINVCSFQFDKHVATET